MSDDDLFPEAYRRVRSRYTADEFGHKSTEEVIAEVRAELDRIRAEQDDPPPG